MKHIKTQPTTREILAARKAAGHTQFAAGDKIGAAMRTWQDWERGRRVMPWGMFELYLLKTGQR